MMIIAHSKRLHRLTQTSLFLILLTGLVSCGDAPICDIDQTVLGISTNTSANAGCVVINEGRLLLIESPLSKVSLPGGAAKSKEPAACTAQRETNEETGLTVIPIELLEIWYNSFYIFKCSIEGESSTRISQPLEVSTIHWLTANEFDQYKWRFEKQKDWLKVYLLKNQP